MFNQIPNFMSSSIPQMGISNAGNVIKTGGILSKIKWGSILSNTQKTLNVVNQAIPLYKEVKPMINNFRALGKIKQEFTKISNEINQEQIVNTNISSLTNEPKDTTDEVIPTPTFFL